MRSAILFILCLIIFACDNPQSKLPPAEPRIVICATVYPLADIARQVGGEHVKLDWIIDLGDPLAGFSIDENDRQRITGVDFVLTNGAATDGWAYQPLQAIKETDRIISMVENTNYGESGARWLDPVVVKDFSLKLAERFAQKMPKYKNEFKKNAEEFIAKIDQITKSASRAPRKMIVTTPLYRPLLDRYGITGVLIDIDHLHYNDVEMKRIKNTAQKQDITRIILPFDTPPGTVADIEAKTGLRTSYIDLLGKSQFPKHANYVEILQFNLDQIADRPG